MKAADYLTVEHAPNVRGDRTLPLCLPSRPVKLQAAIVKARDELRITWIVAQIGCEACRRDLQRHPQIANQIASNRQLAIPGVEARK